MIFIAAIVATYNRPELLTRRALTSISRQTRRPDLLIVVDDSAPEIRSRNRAAVTEYSLTSPRTIYLENTRTPGACGAWNTALYELQRIDPSAFAAVLDDDDMWEPTYLQRCAQAVVKESLDMVASGIVYNVSEEEEGLPFTSPERLNAEDFFVRNPYIQGSNLFVRLEKLLEVDGFDESLTSTTDRDICIRLADLGTVRYGRILDCLVQHYAEQDRPRLSTPGSDAKSRGLTRFFQKYQGRMNDRQREAFIRRSIEVFGCDPTEGLVDRRDRFTPHLPDGQSRRSAP